MRHSRMLKHGEMWAKFENKATFFRGRKCKKEIMTNSWCDARILPKKKGIVKNTKNFY